SLEKFLRAFWECRYFPNVEREKPLRKSILSSLGCEPLTQLENAKNGPGNDNRNAAGPEKLDNVRGQAHMQSSGKPHRSRMVRSLALVLKALALRPSSGFVTADFCRLEPGTSFIHARMRA